MILTSEGKLAEGAEDSCEEGVEGVTVTNKYLSIHDLRNECEQAEHNQSIEHLQLGMCLLLILFDHA